MAAQGYKHEFFQVTFPLEHIAHVEIARPDKLNAFRDPMFENLRLIFNALSQDPAVRCVVLSGQGAKAFTAGLDVEHAAKSGTLAAREGEDPARTATRLRRHVLGLQEALTSIAVCEKPVICAMHAWCLGMAVDIASACDIRLCAADARFSVGSS
ncbi:hypothetical protein MRB53_040604 [Persea americana]|nr:hypothetical protein MRB53_040604 [Persea americana]